MKKAGMPPGSLIYVGEKRTEAVFINQIIYSQDIFEEKIDIAPEDICGIQDSRIKKWIDIDGIHNEKVMQKIGEKFAIHPLTLEDIMNSDHRPKIEFHEDYIFVVLKMLTYDEIDEEIDTEQVSIVFGEDFLVSFQEKKGDVFDNVRKLLKEKTLSRIKKADMDYLAYSLLDSVIDNYYSILEVMGEKIEALEEELLGSSNSELINNIHDLKKKMTILRRAIWPLREVVSSFQKNESPLIKEKTIPFIRDLYDHVIQIIETIEISRDNLSSLIDLYISNNSIKMNETMKVLTIIATIFIPLTFIAGVYGMNFDYMPELKWRAGYPMIMGIMFFIVLLMLYYFKKKKWM